MVSHEVKCPLRPTLLVISAATAYEGRSLAERAGRQYAENMRRLTQKFSPRNWDITVSDMAAEGALGRSWQSLESANMAILTGYRGTEKDNALLAKLSAAASPVMTLINLGADLTKANLSRFQKAASLLIPGLEDQFSFTAEILKQTRIENAWGEWVPRNERRASGQPPKAQQKYIN